MYTAFLLFENQCYISLVHCNIFAVICWLKSEVLPFYLISTFAELHFAQVATVHFYTASLWWTVYSVNNSVALKHPLTYINMYIFTFFVQLCCPHKAETLLELCGTVYVHTVFPIKLILIKSWKKATTENWEAAKSGRKVDTVATVNPFKAMSHKLLSVTLQCKYSQVDVFTDLQ